MKHTPASLTRHDLPAAPGNRSWIIAGVIVAGAAAILWFFLVSLHKDSRSSNPVSTGAEPHSAAGSADSYREGISTHSNSAPSPVPPTEIPAHKSSVPPNDNPLAQGSVTRVPAAIAVASESVTARPAGGTGVSPETARRLSQAARAEVISDHYQPEQDEPAPTEEAALQAQPSAIGDGQTTRGTTPTPRGAQGEALSLREAIEKMAISVLMYSEAKAERRVYINGRKYVEGDYIDGRYLVENITLEGVVLSYEGERATLRSGSR